MPKTLEDKIANRMKKSEYWSASALALEIIGIKMLKSGWKVLPDPKPISAALQRLKRKGIVHNVGNGQTWTLRGNE